MLMPVRFPPGRASEGTSPLATMSSFTHRASGSPGSPPVPPRALGRRSRARQEPFAPAPSPRRRIRRRTRKYGNDGQILSFDETGFTEFIEEGNPLRRLARRSGRYTEAVGPVALLRPHRTTPEDRDGPRDHHGAPTRRRPHSMTSVARARIIRWQCEV